MVSRCLRRSLREPDAFFTALLLPIILLLLFVYVLGGDMRTNSYVDYVVPGLIVLCAGFGASTTAVAVATDMSNGIIDRFRSLPIRASLVLFGQVVASVMRNLIASALVLSVAFGIGWRPRFGIADWLGAAAMLVFFIVALSWLSAGIGLVARTPEAASSFAFLLMFLPYVSTAFVPARTMPWVLRGFAAHQPLTPVIETMRCLWMGHSSTGTNLAHNALAGSAYCAALLVLSLAGSSWLFGNRTGR